MVKGKKNYSEKVRPETIEKKDQTENKGKGLNNKKREKKQTGTEIIENHFHEETDQVHFNWETAELLKLDGSLKEGGGQVLRNTISLSAILSKPVALTNIRNGRDKPGLRPQHLTGLQLIKRMYKAHVVGDKIGSSDVKFVPERFLPGDYVADTVTAGSTGLLVQIALPCLVFSSSPTKLVLKGGTNALMAPPIDYLIHVFLPMVSPFGINAQLTLERRGFYPKGGGIVNLTVEPVHHLNPIKIEERGKLIEISGICYVAGMLPESIAHRIVAAASSVLENHFGQEVPVKILVVKENSHSAFGDGTGITLIAKSSTGALLGASAVGERGVTSEAVGEGAAYELIATWTYGGAVDEYLQDQLIIFMALAKGRSSVLIGPPSLHTQTSIHFSEVITGAKFWMTAVAGEEGENKFLLQCDGIGWENTCINNRTPADIPHSDTTTSSSSSTSTSTSSSTSSSTTT